MSSPINAVPSSTVIATTEVLPVQLDFGPLLQPGETLTGYTSSLTDTTGGASTPIMLPDLPTSPSLGVVQQIIRGSSLSPQHTYRLAVMGTVIVGVKVWGVFIDIVCPF
jgi:hypothetical protein